MSVRRCAHCAQVKPYTDEHFYTRGQSNYWCRVCTRANMAMRYRLAHGIDPMTPMRSSVPKVPRLRRVEPAEASVHDREILDASESIVATYKQAHAALWVITALWGLAA